MFAHPRFVLPAVAATGLLVSGTAVARTTQQAVARTRMAFDRALPAMDGAHLTLKVVDVRYGPGESSPAHKHGCAVVVFVIDGRVRMQVRGGPDSVYRRGETFHETPTDIHQVSANASATDSAHFTATLLCDHDGPLSTPVPPTTTRTAP
ncbi:MAG: cupin domain-containing protein [Gemmatimonadetes bacterium]|nr:cupin domain-containing protein [Gemmatimonadota bacterium]